MASPQPTTTTNTATSTTNPTPGGVEDLDNPQMPKHSNLIELRRGSTKDIEFALNDYEIPDWDELKGATRFKIGIVVGSCLKKDPHISAISKPASSCSLASLVILEKPTEMEGGVDVEGDGEEDQSETMIANWFANNNLNEDRSKIKVSWGQEGFQDLLKSDVDALYVLVPPGFQREYALAALQAGKHVLLNDPVSTSLSEFSEQQEYAKRHGKFVQFSTMFVHQYKVRRFFESVMYDEHFGKIHSINSFVRLSFDELGKVGVKFPLGPNDGSIRVLGRFCVLMSTLFFSRVGSFAQSAQVKYIKEGSSGEILSAECVVKYSEGRTLSFDVGYTHSKTRQSIEVHSDSRSAAMNDFIIEHKDGLSTYRVYEKASTPKSKDFDIKSGEAIDMAGGPSQQMMMWRKFVFLSRSLDKTGGWDRTDNTAECRELANVALQTKRILLALVKSGENNSEEVIIDDIEYQ